MTSSERKQALTELQENKKPAMTGVTIKYNGENVPFNAYMIPLELLVYNPYNGRIGSEVKSYERQHHRINPENAEDVKIVEDFLWKSKETANEKTKESLLNDHQQRWGIVTADGMIIDGNRRASLLNRIMRDDSIDANKKQHCRFFLAIILPQDADKKEIIRLETTYQMGEDEKLDYNPIEKYLKCGDLIEAGFTESEIASFMAIKPAEVMMYLRVLKLMNEYLEAYGYEGMYTQLLGEDSFQKLDAALRSYSSGSASGMWDYDLETDVSDLKQIAFDYIRLGMEQTDFRDIIRKPSTTSPNSSFFACKDIWEEFVDQHFDIVDSVKEKTVQDIIEESPNADLTRLLRQRDVDWRKKVQDGMERNYKDAKYRLDNKKDAGAPIQLLMKAISALSSIDTTQQSFKSDPRVATSLNQLDSLVQDFKKELN